MDNIQYIRLSIDKHVPTSPSRKYLHRLLNELGSSPSNTQLLSVMEAIRGNSPQAFSRAREFSAEDPEILTLFVPAGSANVDRTQINDPTLDKYTTDDTISVVSLAQAIGPIADIFNVSPSTQPQLEPIPNTLTEAIGNIANVRLSGLTPTVVRSIASILGSTKIHNNPSSTITGTIGDMSLVNFGGDSLPPSSISAAIGSNKIGSGQTLTNAIGDLDRIILDGTASDPANSLAATIGQDVALDQDIPNRSSLIQGINSAHSHKAPFLLSFCSAQGDTIGDPIPTPTVIKTVQQPYTADMVGLLKTSSITSSTFTGTDQFFTCLHLVHKIAKGKPGSHTVQNSGTDYTNKAACKSAVSNEITGYATTTPFNTGINEAEVKEALVGEICGQYPD
jgi:hypothetical protein